MSHMNWFCYLLLRVDLGLPEATLPDLPEWTDLLLDLLEPDLLLPTLECLEPDLLLPALECLDPDFAGDLLLDLGLRDFLEFGLSNLFVLGDLLADLEWLLFDAFEGWSSSSEWLASLGLRCVDCTWACEEVGLPLRLDDDEADPLSESDPVWKKN